MIIEKLENDAFQTKRKIFTVFINFEKRILTEKLSIKVNMVNKKIEDQHKINFEQTNKPKLTITNTNHKVKYKIRKCMHSKRKCNKNVVYQMYIYLARGILNFRVKFNKKKRIFKTKV